MVDPATAMLAPFERASLLVGRWANERPLPKRLQQAALANVTWRWIWAGVSRRVFVDGLDPLLQLDPAGGVVLAVNHRTFFDLWIAMLPLFARRPAWLSRVFFPVRSEFFYERPLGLLVNLAAGAGCMYPPIFRDRQKAALNTQAIAMLSRQLERPGTVVGMHPEGTRNQGDNPYALLPARPGVGEMVLGARPTVIPTFINGLSRSAVENVRRAWLEGEPRRVDPIILVFGAPVDYDEFLQQTARVTLYKRVADRIHQAIAGCGARERELRAELATGRLDRHHGWLNRRDDLI